jgi:hypothetical protein
VGTSLVVVRGAQVARKTPRRLTIYALVEAQYLIAS